MSVAALFQKELVLTHVEASNTEELFDKVGAFLLEKGLVTDEYCQAIKKRESEFPTGLITQYLNISLPHTDSVYVTKPFVCVVRTEKQIDALQMGDNQPMQVEHFFFLGIKEQEGYSQVVLLSKLMEIFASETFVNEYKQAETAEEIIRIIQENLKEDL